MPTKPSQARKPETSLNEDGQQGTSRRESQRVRKGEVSATLPFDDRELAKQMREVAAAIPRRNPGSDAEDDSGEQPTAKGTARERVAARKQDAKEQFLHRVRSKRVGGRCDRTTPGVGDLARMVGRVQPQNEVNLLGERASIPPIAGVVTGTPVQSPKPPQSLPPVPGSSAPRAAPPAGRAVPMLPSDEVELDDTDSSESPMSARPSISYPEPGGAKPELKHEKHLIGRLKRGAKLARHELRRLNSVSGRAAIRLELARMWTSYRRTAALGLRTLANIIDPDMSAKKTELPHATDEL